DRSAAASSMRMASRSFALVRFNPWTERGENQPNDAFWLEAVTLGLARIALIVRSRRPLRATTSGATRARTRRNRARTPKSRMMRLLRPVGVGGLRGTGALAAGCSLMAACTPYGSDLVRRAGVSIAFRNGATH